MISNCDYGVKSALVILRYHNASREDYSNGVVGFPWLQPCLLSTVHWRPLWPLQWSKNVLEHEVCFVLLQWPHVLRVLRPQMYGWVRSLFIYHRRRQKCWFGWEYSKRVCACECIYPYTHTSEFMFACTCEQASVFSMYYMCVCVYGTIHSERHGSRQHHVEHNIALGPLLSGSMGPWEWDTVQSPKKNLGAEHQLTTQRISVQITFSREAHAGSPGMDLGVPSPLIPQSLRTT